ncbi:hypothetical protein CW362_30570 [Streptomyces populi]|uniref:Uncharacterized protein n=1 Tax=Streptomyces populi TaxID=2058924 RepID=A0A2I0SH55_9ACTN|nr:hypothetical protein [Streptomyces populi]PKT69267.1 hypothetical protein CW362_30570 [Streptomyces populi]
MAPIIRAVARRERVTGAVDPCEDRPGAPAAADLVMEPWQRPSDAHLVQLGLDALTTGVEAPSLPLPAGLARGEDSRARELFDLVLEESGLLPPSSEGLAEARWTAARWWAGQIVARRLDPVHGAKLIHEEAAAELGHPDALQPIVDLAGALDPPNDRPPDQQHIRDQVTSAARDFLATEAHQKHSL